MSTQAKETAPTVGVTSPSTGHRNLLLRGTHVARRRFSPAEVQRETYNSYDLKVGKSLVSFRSAARTCDAQGRGAVYGEVTPRVAVFLVALAAVGFLVAGCGAGGLSHLQTTDLPYTVARIKPSIEAARAADPSLFSIFPSAVSTRTCKIPRGGPASNVMTLPGTFATGLTYEKNGTAVVSFTERWHEPGKTSRSRRHTWRVIVSIDGTVVMRRESGTAAPQSWS